MIPKKLHWCWLSNNPLPALSVECVKSWKKHFPDYEIKLWNEKNFDVEAFPYVAQAVKAKKWAFACDYIRTYALYTEGGIYLDADVFVRKNFDFVLENRAFSAIEYFPERYEKALEEGVVDRDGNKNPNAPFVPGAQIQSAIIGAEKGHPFFKDVLDHFDKKGFLQEDGTYDLSMILPHTYANLAEKYGFRYIPEAQQLDEGFRLYDSKYFPGYTYLATKEAYAIHCCNGSWREPGDPDYTKRNKFIDMLKRIASTMGLIRLDRIKHMEELG